MALTPDLKSIRVALGERGYEITIGTRVLDQVGLAIAGWLGTPGAAGRSALVVTDAHVESTHAAAVVSSLSAAGFVCAVASLPPGEETKSLEEAARLYDRLVDLQADRKTAVVAVGGGVVGDLAGFVAATYARGIPFVQVPTTLLAQVDSSVGGKVGINHPKAKNLIGAFYQPLGVFIDTSLLDTLPVRDYRSGLAEVVKYGMILDEKFFDWLEANVPQLNARDAAALRHVVAQSCRLKADVVEKDEFERTGLRAVLNYGHTYAHAFEALAGYGELLHGEAVSIGMQCAARLAARLGRIDASIVARQEALLVNLGLPVRLPPQTSIAPEDVLATMRLDKKSVAGKLRFVLPTRIGHVELVDGVADAEAAAAL
jgi:3-dehydroquinate synthase